ncbi:DUF4012 domain-containing protein [Demequina soli]|uniref:DUF4012 domain-containing protein n=1 Tax=Demequina soli TaxID=1638987 RepID=UPI00078022E1|nr:DUF4012 domain-containing protein [Demequina soli]
MTVEVPARRRRRWPWVVAGMVVLAGVALAGLFAYDAWRLRGASQELTAQAADAQAAVAARDVTALRADVEALSESAATFTAATSGPHWWLATHVPWVRDQAVPLVTAGEAVTSLVSGALEPLASLDGLDALAAPSMTDGRIDPQVLEPARAALASAASAVDGARASLADVPLDGTLEQIRQPFVSLEGALVSLGDVIDGAHVAAELLPAMLSADGPRTYVVVVQNNAEPRATGGLPGAFLELTVADGRMTLGRYASAQQLASADGAPVADLTEDERRIFTERMAIYPHDANFTPEFPRTAQLISEFWAAKYGAAPDGVLSVDPVALGWMLEGAPTVQAGGMEIGSANLADVMLNQAYSLSDDPVEQDAFFSTAAQALFGQIVTGQGDTIGGVERAIDAHRLLIWSARADEQELLASTPVGGDFLAATDTVGVFLNDGSGSKIGYYLDTSVAVTDRMCTDGTLAEETVAVTLTHTYSGDVADLPEYVAGGFYVPAGQFQGNLLLYPSEGLTVTSVTQDGEAVGLVPDSHDGRAMSQLRVTLDPGEATTVTYSLTASSTGLLPPSLVVTPGPRDATPTRTVVAAEGC